MRPRTCRVGQARAASAGPPCFLIALFVPIASCDTAFTADPPAIKLERGENHVVITAGTEKVATYVFRDERIPRPYFAHLFAPGNVQVSRNHPPVPGKDALDHDLFHPGLWLAFGELSGHDYWRLKAKVQHDGFSEELKSERGRGSFAVRNKYLSTKGDETVCVETCRYTVLARPAGWLLLSDSTFTSDSGALVFGDQEEMGLGLRVATPLAVKNGGRIKNSEGKTNEKEVWGRQADWCDYSGVIEGRRVGMTLMPDPANFGRSWFHARDYGFVAANPFGRNAFTRGDVSRLVVRRGKSLRLSFGVLLHAAPEGKETDLAAAYLDYLEQHKSSAK